MLNEFTALRVRAGLSVEDLALMTGYACKRFSIAGVSKDTR